MTSPTDDLAGLLARLVAAFRARSAGVGAAGADLGAGLGVDLAGGAAGRASAAASPLMFASGAARSSDMSAAAPQAVQTDPAPMPEATPTSEPINLSDRVRTGGSEAFNAANAANPASLASAPGKDMLGQLTDVFTSSNLKTANVALRVAQMFGSDQHAAKLPPASAPMRLPAQRRAPVPMPKATPRARPHQPLAISSGSSARVRRLLLQLLGGASGR